MSLLPRRRLVVIHLTLVVLLSLFTLTLTPSAFASSGTPPNPQPCQNALETNNLTDHYITNARGDAFFDQDFPVTGSLNETKTINVSGQFQVDFSKIQSLFASPITTDLEGNFAADTHRSDDISNLNSQDFNSFHGAGQKAIPKIIMDTYKTKYVQYLFDKPELPESVLTYKDINGQGNPKTIYQLVNDFGQPNPPSSLSTDEEKQQWLDTWGKYWEKIPTSYDEFYKGKIQFRLAKGQKQFQQIKNGELCPIPATEIEFVLPQFFKTTTVADELNQVIVPKTVQSYQDHETIKTSGLPNLFANIKNFCRELFDKPQEVAKNILKISLNKLNPVKTAFAETPSCIAPIPSGPKQGSAPFCALPPDQAAKALSCSNKDDPNKLDSGNPNVVCTFAFNATYTLTIRPTSGNPEERQDDDFDRCQDPEGDGTFSCDVEIRGWPVLMIPYITEIYNSTYNSQNEGGIYSPQEQGRPGVYKYFIPNSIQFQKDDNLKSLLKSRQDCITDSNSLQCQDLIAAWQLQGCAPEQIEDEFLKCLGYSPSIPGQVVNSAPGDLKERFIGSSKCANEFTRDIALKSKPLQQQLGVSTDCLNKNP